MIVLEDWIETSFSEANQEPESAINLAELYWKGLDPNFYLSLVAWSNLAIFGSKSEPHIPSNFRWKNFDFVIISKEPPLNF